MVGFVARMDVTKQKDMSAFYRNLLDQSTDTVVKMEPVHTVQSEGDISTDEWYMCIICPANAEYYIVIDI